MADQREEARRQLEYIDRELAAGKHDYPGRAKMLQDRRADIVERMERRASADLR